MSGRPPKQQDAIVRRLRKLAWRHGDRLPSVRQLAQEFHASTRTVQLAIKRLKADGLVQGRAGVATFMTANHPVPARYVLAVPHDPADLTSIWSRFYATLVNEAPAVAQATGRVIIPFYGLESGPRAAGYAQLEQWCAEGSLAGIIFANNPYPLTGTPILDRPGIPRVALMNPQQFPHVPAVSLNGSFFSKACAWLAGRGRRKLAVVMQWDELAKQRLTEQATHHGLELPASWQLPMTAHLPATGGAYVKLLLAASVANRPDAVVVGDDNYLESVLDGLRATDVRLGVDLDVVTHCNFPWAGRLPAAVQKLGYSARTVLETCLELLDRNKPATICRP